jgi:hypothetical protein
MRAKIEVATTASGPIIVGMIFVYPTLVESDLEEKWIYRSGCSLSSSSVLFHAVYVSPDM